MSKKIIILLFFIAAKFILQYVLISPAYDLQRDEYLHLDQANHLAWGYISVPPVTSWISYIIRLLGNGIFWVKFFPALFGALTMVIVYRIVVELKGNLYALVLSLLAILVSAILRINILFQPNSLDIFFWSFCYFTLIKYINTHHGKWLIWTAIGLAVGILCKYNIIFLLIGLVPAVLFTEHRKIFSNKNFYIGFAIACIIILPNIIWQYKNGFPTFSQLNELSMAQLVNVNRWDFVKEQFLFFFSSVFVIIAGFIGLFFYPPFKKFRFILWSFAFTIGLFIFFKAKSYYAIGLYPVLIAIGAVYLESLFAIRWRILKPISIAIVAVFSIPFILVAFPTRSPKVIQKKSEQYKNLGLLRWEDGKDHAIPQDFADMIGWKELAMKVDDVYSRLEEKEQTLVLCDNYGQAGAINYYSAFSHINAVSFNADYINWMQFDKPIKHAIIVKDIYDMDSTREKEKPIFDTIQLVGKIENPFARELGTRIFLLKGARININKLIADEVRRKKEAND